MIVCHCNAVSDRTIRRVVREGAASVAEVSRACGGGGRCGGCRMAIESILEHEQHAAARESAAPLPAHAQLG